MVTRQQALLDCATVCLRLLKDNASNPDNRRTLECLRGFWQELALEISCLSDAEVGEQIKALSDVQANILAEIRQTPHYSDSNSERIAGQRATDRRFGVRSPSP
jgi:hypothetical protein